MIEDGLQGIYPKKAFTIGGKVVEYSAITHFYDCQTVFESKQKQSIDFRCIQCGKSYKAKIGKSGNLKKHLEKSHKNLKNWLRGYLLNINRSETKWTLDDNLTNLAKYFLTSNQAIKEIENPYFRKMLSFEIPCQNT